MRPFLCVKPLFVFSTTDSGAPKAEFLRILPVNCIYLNSHFKLNINFFFDFLSRLFQVPPQLGINRIIVCRSLLQADVKMPGRFWL